MSFYDTVTSAVKKGIAKSKELHKKSEPYVQKAGRMIERYAEQREGKERREPKEKVKMCPCSETKTIIKKRQGLHKRKR